MTFLNSNSKSFKNPPTDQHCCFDYNENEGLLLPKGKHTYKEEPAILHSDIFHILQIYQAAILSIKSTILLIFWRQPEDLLKTTFTYLDIPGSYILRICLENYKYDNAPLPLLPQNLFPPKSGPLLKMYDRGRS